MTGTKDAARTTTDALRSQASATDLVESTIAAIRPLDAEALAAARARQETLTKPPGSMGILEQVGNQLCGIAGTCPPPLPEPSAVAVFAADHGVVGQGVSAWPQEVTVQMLANVVTGGAVVNVLARQVGAGLLAVDVGVAGDVPAGVLPELTAERAARLAVTPGGIGYLSRRVARGTADLSEGAAMSVAQAHQAMAVGIETAELLCEAGAGLLATGDLGIGNTTPSAALVAAFTGRDPADVTGAGAGSDAYGLARKVAAIRRALQRHVPRPDRPVETLAALGGFEHAAMVGFVLAAAARRVPVVLDGVIAASAALAAVAMCPPVRDGLLAGHRSVEPGSTAALAHLELVPLIDQGLRLGEGTGAVLAIPSVQAAARILREVATFDSAGVSHSIE